MSERRRRSPLRDVGNPPLQEGCPAPTKCSEQAGRTGERRGPPQAQKQSDSAHEARRNQPSEAPHKEKPNFCLGAPSGEARRPEPAPNLRRLPAAPLAGSLRPPSPPRSRLGPPRPPWLPKRLHSLAKIRPMPGLGLPPGTQGSPRRRWLPPGGRSPQRPRGSGRHGGEGGAGTRRRPAPGQRPRGASGRPNAHTAVAPRHSVRHRVRPRRAACAGAAAGGVEEAAPLRDELCGGAGRAEVRHGRGRGRRPAGYARSPAGGRSGPGAGALPVGAGSVLFPSPCRSAGRCCGWPAALVTAGEGSRRLFRDTDLESRGGGAATTSQRPAGETPAAAPRC